MEKKIIVAIRCENCGRWNVPKISNDGKIIYPKACVNNRCRSITYMKARSYVRKQKQERARSLKKFLVEKRQNPSQSKKIYTFAMIYNRNG